MKTNKNINRLKKKLNNSKNKYKKTHKNNPKKEISQKIRDADFGHSAQIRRAHTSTRQLSAHIFQIVPSEVNV
jgi:hypothetical protein